MYLAACLGAARCRTTQMHRTVHTRRVVLAVGVSWREIGRERERELDTRLTNGGVALWGGGERACPEPHVSTTTLDTTVLYWRRGVLSYSTGTGTDTASLRGQSINVQQFTQHVLYTLTASSLYTHLSDVSVHLYNVKYTYNSYL